MSFFGLRFLIIFQILFVENSTVESNLQVFFVRTEGSSLLLLRREHCVVKKSLKSSVFFLKSIINLPLCNRGGIQGIHYLPLCPNFSNERLTLFNELQSIDENILSKDDSNISKVFLFGDNSFNDAKNTSVLTASIEYIISTKRFDAPLYQN